jgi:hypothetical protein
MVRRVRLNDVNEVLVEELTEMILGMGDYDQQLNPKII